MQKRIEDIEDNYSENNDWYGSFECPACFQNWGPSNNGDPPGEVSCRMKCTCGAILEVNGEWVSEYRIDAELIDEMD